MKMRPCQKVRHATRRIAEQHAESVRKRNGERLHAYVCNYCGGWHVGHNHKDPAFQENLDPAEVVMPFGHLKGWPLKKIPRSYLEWAAQVEPAKQPVVKYIRLYLAQTEPVAEPPKDCHTAPLKSKTIGSTPSFFVARVEGDGRRVKLRNWKRRGNSSN